MTAPKVVWQSVRPGWRYQVRRHNGGERVQYEAHEDEVELLPAPRRQRTCDHQQEAIDCCERWRKERCGE
jgi:hypothetical protein